MAVRAAELTGGRVVVLCGVQATPQKDMARDKSKRCVWCGGLPERQASEHAVRAGMAQIGEVEAVHLRRKAGLNKSWALVVFESAAPVQDAISEGARVRLGAQATASWKVKPVEPERLRSLEASFTLQNAASSQRELQARKGDGVITSEEFRNFFRTYGADASHLSDQGAI